MLRWEMELTWLSRYFPRRHVSRDLHLAAPQALFEPPNPTNTPSSITPQLAACLLASSRCNRRRFYKASRCPISTSRDGRLPPWTDVLGETEELRAARSRALLLHRLTPETGDLSRYLVPILVMTGMHVLIPCLSSLLSCCGSEPACSLNGHSLLRCLCRRCPLLQPCFLLT